MVWCGRRGSKLLRDAMRLCFAIVLRQGVFLAAGIAAAAAAASKTLLSAADVVSALSAEVSRAHTDALDGEVLDARGSNSQTATANAIRILVEGSSLCTRAPGACNDHAHSVVFVTMCW